MTRNYDVIVVGLGAFGSAAAAELALSGQRVLGLDRFAPPHDQGSSSGSTRILRLAYAEDSGYVPLLHEAYDGWQQLDDDPKNDAGKERCFVNCGGLFLGEEQGELIEGVDLTVQQFDLSIERLDAAEVCTRFPLLVPDQRFVARLDPHAGFLRVAPSLRAQLRRARQAGADLRVHHAVDGWQVEPSGAVTVSVGDQRHSAPAMVLTAGAWLSDPALAPIALRRHLDVRRQTLFWFTPTGGASAWCASSRQPVFVWEHEPRRNFYGFPDDGEGIKVAIHHEGKSTTPDGVDRTVHRTDLSPIRALLARHLPGRCGTVSRSEVCLYTNTPDGHFVIDRHPDHRQVVFASACSGHGFKFAPAVGRVLCDLVQGQPPRVNLESFSLARLTRLAEGEAGRRIRGGSHHFVGSS